MAQDLERIRARLDNIRAVRPVLSALRTISLGSWQAALNRLDDLRRYSERLLGVLPPLLPHLQAHQKNGRAQRLWPAPAWGYSRWPASAPLVPHVPQPLVAGSEVAPAPSAERVCAVVLGSERGLCGRYNGAVLDRAAAYLDVQAAGARPSLTVMGARAIRVSQRRAYALEATEHLPVTTLPAFELAHGWARRWLRAYEAFELDAVDVVYNAYENAGRYRPTVLRLLPPPLPAALRASSGGAAGAAVIVETDPAGLCARVIEQWTVLRFYTLLLEAAASEHSARFQLMESAAKNTERLVAELTLAVQSARREAITREMQELVVGAGMLEA